MNEEVLLTHELIMTSLIKHQQPHYKCILFAMTIFAFIVVINHLFIRGQCHCQEQKEQQPQQNNKLYGTNGLQPIQNHPYTMKRLQLTPNYY